MVKRTLPNHAQRSVAQLNGAEDHARCGWSNRHVVVVVNVVAVPGCHHGVVCRRAVLTRVGSPCNVDVVPLPRVFCTHNVPCRWRRRNNTRCGQRAVRGNPRSKKGCSGKCTSQAALFPMIEPKASRRTVHFEVADNVGEAWSFASILTPTLAHQVVHEVRPVRPLGHALARLWGKQHFSPVKIVQDRVQSCSGGKRAAGPLTPSVTSSPPLPQAELLWRSPAGHR